ncbi:MAG: glycosyltransferase family 4 protein [Candidatus Omnitrophota bacterium]
MQLNSRISIKKILYIIGSSEIGGAESALCFLATALKERDYKIYIICHGDGIMKRKFEACSEKVFSIDQDRIFNLKSLFLIMKVIREIKPDIIHTHMFVTDFIAGISARLSGIKKLFTTIHGYYFAPLDYKGIKRFKKKILSYFYRSIYMLFDKVIVVSVAVKEDLISRKGIKVLSDKIYTVYHIEDFKYPIFSESNIRERFGLKEDIKIVSVVSNFYHIKGYIYLLRAIKELLDEIDNVVFIFKGHGEQKKYIKKEVERLDIQEKLLFLDVDFEVKDLLKGSDLFVLPSLSEGFPLTLIEAMWCETPIVATNVGGVREILTDKENALLVAPYNVGQLKEAMLSLLRNDGYAKSLATRGKERLMMRFSHENMIQGIVNIYSGVSL